MHRSQLIHTYCCTNINVGLGDAAPTLLGVLSVYALYHLAKI